MRLWVFAPTALFVGCTALAGLDELRFEGDGGGGSPGTGGEGGTAATGGGGSLPVRFEDRVAADFEQGSFNDTGIDDDAVLLNIDAESGRFLSRVFDAQRPVRITQVSWLPSHPYGKPLPRGGGVDTGYPRGGVDMGDAILHLDFDGGDVDAPTQFTNHAPKGQPAVVNGPATPLPPGRAGLGYADTTDTKLEIAVDAMSPFQFGAGDFTWAYWFRSTQSCPSNNPPFGNRVHLGIEETAGDQTHLWLGCTSSAACTGAGGHLGGTFRMTSGEGHDYCGEAVINDGQWHHLALVKSGHGAATLRLFVDGLLDLELGVPFVGEAAFAGVVPFFVGGFTNDGFQAQGLFDDVVVATRAWNAVEVASACARHALGLTLRVRTCNEPDCADDPSFGPPMRDDIPDTNAPLVREVEGSSGRYVQYEVELSAENSLRPSFGEVIIDVAE